MPGGQRCRTARCCVVIAASSSSSMTKDLAVVQGPIGVTFLHVTDGLSDGVND